tara:strand:- start:241 stop:441 length:201 start_codon:yes stop_codon:yes gene_type:complete
MDVRAGTIPLGSLAIIFALFQIWWIGTTIQNGRAAEKAVKMRRGEKALKKDPLRNERERLEKILRK